MEKPEAIEARSLRAFLKRIVLKKGADTEKHQDSK